MELYRILELYQALHVVVAMFVCETGIILTASLPVCLFFLPKFDV